MSAFEEDGVISNLPATRRRSSSAARHLAGGPPGLNRTFSRARTKSDHRRLSSACDLSNLLVEANTQPFNFETNVHGNGGLKNAVRSVAEAHARTAIEPNHSSSIPKTLRASVPATKTAIGNHIWLGTLGCSTNDFEANLKQAVEKRYRDELQSVVVWIDDHVLEPAYDLYCKQVRKFYHLHWTRDMLESTLMVITRFFGLHFTTKFMMPTNPKPTSRHLGQIIKL